MTKRHLHNFDGVKELFNEWWKMLKEHHAQLQASGWTEEAWAKVISETGKWHTSYGVPFAVRLGAVEIDILQWLRENEG